MKWIPSVAISLAIGASHPSAMTQEASAQSSCGSGTTITAGETLSDVAERCDVTIDALLEANPEVSWREIRAGAEIDMPGICGDCLNRARDAVRAAGEEVGNAAEDVGRAVTDYLSDNPDLSRDFLDFGERMGLPG